jgi:hypothetical protein
MLEHRLPSVNYAEVLCASKNFGHLFRQQLKTNLDPPERIGLVLKATEEELQVAHLAQLDAGLQAHAHLQGKLASALEFELLRSQAEPHWKAIVRFQLIWGQRIGSHLSHCPIQYTEVSCWE